MSCLRILPPLLLALALWAVWLPGMAAMAQESSLPPNAPSPATRHAQVIAHGVAAMPAEEIGWLVRASRAVSPNRAVAEERGPEFILADEGVVALTDERGTLRQRIAPGEAVWTDPNAMWAVVTLEQEPVDFYEIALVPASELGAASQEGTPGPPFAAPEGDAFDVDLIRDVLDRAGESVVSTGPSPAMLLVTNGAVFVESDPGDATQLAAGEVAQIAGEVIITGASRAPAAFVVARIGPEVPARVTLQDTAPRPTPTPTPGIVPAQQASVVIAAAICPVAYPGTDYAADCASPADGVEFNVAAGNAIVETVVAGADGDVEFSPLRPGSYTLNGGIPGDFASSRVRCLNAFGDDIADRAGTNQIAVTLEAGDTIACDWYIVPEDARGEEPAPGFVAISSFICPVAHEGGDYAAVCVDPASGIEFIISLGDAVIDSTAAGPGGDVAFQPVAAGDYVLAAGVPGDFASSRVSCLNNAGEDIAERAATNQIALSLPSGDHVTCTWYIVPEDARGEAPAPTAFVGISSFVCPAGYDAGDYGAVCTDPADGVEFSITANDTLVQASIAGPGGEVAFGGLPSGDYVLVAGIPGESTSSRVRCLNSAGEDITRRYATNQIAVSVLPGDSVACNWYIVPVSEQG